MQKEKPKMTIGLLESDNFQFPMKMYIKKNWSYPGSRRIANPASFSYAGKKKTLPQKREKGMYPIKVKKGFEQRKKVDKMPFYL